MLHGQQNIKLKTVLFLIICRGGVVIVLTTEERCEHVTQKYNFK
jgi:hypothetical protein